MGKEEWRQHVYQIECITNRISVIVFFALSLRIDISLIPQQRTHAPRSRKGMCPLEHVNYVENLKSISNEIDVDRIVVALALTLNQ